MLCAMSADNTKTAPETRSGRVYSYVISDCRLAAERAELCACLHRLAAVGACHVACRLGSGCSLRRGNRLGRRSRSGLGHGRYRLGYRRRSGLGHGRYRLGHGSRSCLLRHRGNRLRHGSRSCLLRHRGNRLRHRSRSGLGHRRNRLRHGSRSRLLILLGHRGHLLILGHLLVLLRLLILLIRLRNGLRFYLRLSSGVAVSVKTGILAGCKEQLINKVENNIADDSNSKESGDAGNTQQREHRNAQENQVNSACIVAYPDEAKRQEMLTVCDLSSLGSVLVLCPGAENELIQHDTARNGSNYAKKTDDHIRYEGTIDRIAKIF